MKRLLAEYAKSSTSSKKVKSQCDDIDPILASKKGLSIGSKSSPASESYQSRESGGTKPEPANESMLPIIPPRLCSFYHDKNEIPPKMKKCYKELLASNPKINATLYDIDSGLKFLKEHFDDRVIHAYVLLKPFAFKSDLLRYCVLYIFGGIYLDMKYTCVGGFKLKELLGREYFVSEPHGIQNCLIVVHPQNGLLKKLIDTIVEHVEARDYCREPTAITGPILISRLYKEYYPLPSMQLHQQLSWTWRGAWPGIHVITRRVQSTPTSSSQEQQPKETQKPSSARAVLYSGAGISSSSNTASSVPGEVILQQYPEYRYELARYSDQPHYTQLYGQRNVYGELSTK